MSDLDGFIIRSRRTLEKFDEFMERVEPLLTRLERLLAAEKEQSERDAAAGKIR